MIVIRVTASAVPCAEPIPTHIITIGILHIRLTGAFGAMTGFHGPGLVLTRLHRHRLDPVNQERHKGNRRDQAAPLTKEGSSIDFHKRILMHESALKDKTNFFALESGRSRGGWCLG